MKKLLVLAIIVIAVIYGVGYTQLGEAAVVRHLDKWERVSESGDRDETCGMLHDDLSVEIKDQSTAESMQVRGGKAELCQMLVRAATILRNVQYTSNVRREELVVKRDWLHPWTSVVSYTEHRDLTMNNGRRELTHNTVSDDVITLVFTLTGVKIKVIKSEVWAAS
jgi:hypothetical protein